MAAERRVVVLLFAALALLTCLPLQTCGAKVARVRIANYIAPSASTNGLLQITVNIKNVENKTQYHNFSCGGTNHTSDTFTVSVPSTNGPESYWSISITCLGTPHTMEDWLFLNSSAPNNTMNTLFFYDECSSHTQPQMWIHAGNEHDVPVKGIDKGLLLLHNQMSIPLNYSQKSDNCYKCSDYSIGLLRPGETVYVTVDTTFPLTIFLNWTNGTFCHVHRQYEEHSVYRITVSGEEGNCSVIPENASTKDNPDLPILYAASAILAITVTMVLGYIGYKCIVDKGYSRYFHVNKVDRVAARDLGSPKQVSSKYGATGEREPLVHDTSSLTSSLNSNLITKGTQVGGEASKPEDDTEGKPKKIRLKSLDAFRGLSLIIMIFVNYGGGKYWFFNHSAWNGLTVADLVFPWFVWIMGVSVVFSFRSRRKDLIWSRLYQIVRRSIILFGLGLFLNNGFDLTHWRIPGVLQRFGITYFVVALTELLTTELYSRWKFTLWKPVRDLTNNWVQWAVILVLEVLWLMLTWILLPVKNCPRGYLGPGGLSEWSQYYDCTGGAAGMIDRWLFTDGHIYQHPTAKDLYQLRTPYDPEGALGTLNSIVICFLGVQAGRILTYYHSHHIGIIVRLSIWGVALGLVGAVLCEGQQNEGVIPINKNLWSLSFILVMAGTGFLLLALFYFFIDVIHWWNGAPFKYPGMNSIIVYVGSELLESYFPFSWKEQYDSHLNMLAANLIAVIIWMLIAYYWFWIGFFVKI